MTRLLLLLSCLLLSLLAPLYAAENGVLLTEGIQLKVADAFMDEGEYYRAITEYKKFLILFPESEKADYAFFRIGMAYYHGEEFESSVRSLTTLRDKYPQSSYIPQALYFEGLSCWKTKRYTEARDTLETLTGSYPGSESAPRALVAEAMLALDLEEVGMSKRDLQTLVQHYPDFRGSGKTGEAIRLLDQYQNLPRKSEALAGVMSALLPGSGYFYAEHYSDGATAFVINALAIAGAVTAVTHENYAVAGIVGGVGLPFYLGNIYGSANAAKKWNIAIRKELQNRIHVTLGYDF